jgi:photosystem II stability/assembly factor-like uncharacterized protein
MRTIAILCRISALIAVIAVAASSAAVVAGCGSSGPAGPAHQARAADHRAAHPTSLAPSRPAAFGPVGATFITRSVGWMLGVTLTGRQHLELFRTEDGGRHWAALATPPAPWQWQSNIARPDGVSGVTFADARDGWMFGPGLWATHDGGRSWHRLTVNGGQADSVQAAGGQVLAVFTSCRAACQSGRPRFAVYHSPAGRDDWRPVNRASGLGAGQLALAGLTGYALGRPGYGELGSLVGTADLQGHWQHRPLPCAHNFLPAIVAASAAGVVVGCEWPPGEHPVPVRLYRSANGGLSWHALIALSLEDGIGTLTITPAGVIIAGGMYNGMTISRDGGRSWHWVRSVDRTDAVGGGGLIEVTMFGNRVGVALVQMERAWLTRDGGRTWRPVTIP